jgi:uncharacterized protein
MIFETVIISTDDKNVPHVTPFGVRHEGEHIIISPFKPSKTLNNILTTKVATMNITDDVRVFAGALTNRPQWELELTDDIKGFRLRDCLMHAELELSDVREDEVRPQLVMTQIKRQHHADFNGFNRAQAAVIELAVLTSRLHMLSPEKIQSELKYLQIAIDKTAGENELEAWSWLTEKINQYYENN